MDKRLILLCDNFDLPSLPKNYHQPPSTSTFPQKAPTGMHGDSKVKGSVCANRSRADLHLQAMQICKLRKLTHTHTQAHATIFCRRCTKQGLQRVFFPPSLSRSHAHLLTDDAKEREGREEKPYFASQGKTEEIFVSFHTFQQHVHPACIVSEGVRHSYTGRCRAAGEVGGLRPGLPSLPLCLPGNEALSLFTRILSRRVLRLV